MWSQSRQCFLIITDQHLSLHCICKVVKLALVIICRLVSEFDGFDFRRASRWGWWSGTITWWSTSAIRVSTTGWAWAPSGRPSSSAPPTSTSSKWSDPGIFNRQPLRSLSAKFFSLLKKRGKNLGSLISSLCKCSIQHHLETFLFYPWPALVGVGRPCKG